MAIILEKESLSLSEGEVRNLRKQVGEILSIIPPGISVTLEGTPIYLDRLWGLDHTLGYNHILGYSREFLLNRGSSVAHQVLLDDYTVKPHVDPQEYLLKIQPPVDSVVNEGDFVSRAEELIFLIGRRKVTRLDGREVILITQSGRVSCAVLDAAFQETKETDFNVLIHPIEFSNEQDETRSILLAARRRLPSTFINIFFKQRSINKVFITKPEEERPTRVL